MFFFFIPALLIALLLEGTITTIPLVLIVLLCLTILRRDGIVFPLALLAGILLDVLTIRTLGASSVFFTIMLFMILLYQRKYEINSYPFVAAAAFVGALVYLSLFGRGNLILDSLLGSFIALLFFAGFRFFASRSMNHEARSFRSMTHDS